MSSVIWYLYEFARKSWVEGFANAKSQHDIVEKPDRFRDFPRVQKEYCIGCGACTLSCPSPHAIKLIREEDTEDTVGLTYPVIDNRGCIRCGFCAEVCPTDPKTILCGENHLIREEFNIIPSKRKYVVDNFLCIKCKKCIRSCRVDAISEINNKVVVDQGKCISCGDCLDVCPVKGAMKGIFVETIEDQKQIIKIAVNGLSEYIESKREELDVLDDNTILKLQFPLSKIWNDIIAIVPDIEIANEVVTNAINRLMIRLITWDEDNCKACQLCVKECPTGAITFLEDENKATHNKDKCLRCSICYQTCPFSVVRYFVVKFSLTDNNEDKDKIIRPVNEDDESIKSSVNDSTGNSDSLGSLDEINNKVILITVRSSQLSSNVFI
ncbi:4Fe-4S binding protein [Methanobrevibacter filiformis]|uniref:Ferredoxin n=1 Tax=Methanobrevibacter filiformis TaxID=55758 RepID=A0A166EVY3_9EURY|nr:4Fe-4S binding protein [Methanobrevibacter filiformis]KZX17071.1 ferredoxin [Methanobrevibacter filiformis]